MNQLGLNYLKQQQILGVLLLLMRLILHILVR